MTVKLPGEIIVGQHPRGDERDPHLAAPCGARRDGGQGEALFQNAATFYVSAQIWEMLGEPNDAYIDLKKALEIYPENPYVQQDVVRLGKRPGMREDLEDFARRFPAMARRRMIAAPWHAPGWSSYEGLAPQKSALSIHPLPGADSVGMVLLPMRSGAAAGTGQQMAAGHPWAVPPHLRWGLGACSRNNAGHPDTPVGPPWPRPPPMPCRTNPIPILSSPVRTPPSDSDFSGDLGPLVVTCTTFLGTGRLRSYRPLPAHAVLSTSLIRSLTISVAAPGDAVDGRHSHAGRQTSLLQVTRTIWVYIPR